MVDGITTNYYTIMIYKLFTRCDDGRFATSWANTQKQAIELMKTIATDTGVVEINCSPMVATACGRLIPSEDHRHFLLQRLSWQGDDYTITAID